jgi:hypothetical protein
VKIAKLLGCANEIRVPTTSNSLHNNVQAPDPHHANTMATPGSSSVTWTISLTSLYLQVTPMNIDAIDPSQSVTSSYSQVTSVNIDAICHSQPATLLYSQVTPVNIDTIDPSRCTDFTQAEHGIRDLL